MLHAATAAILVLALAGPALAHPGSHAEFQPVSGLIHQLTDPFHLLMIAVAAIAAVGGVVLFRRARAIRNRR